MTLTVGTIRGLEGLKGLQTPQDLVEVAQKSWPTTGG